MIRIREAGPEDAGALWAVQIATTDSTFRGCVADDQYARMCGEVRRANPWPRWLANPRSFTLAAEVAGGGRGGQDARAGWRLVAYATGGAPRPDPPGWDGELFLLYVLAAHQRRGIGRWLVGEVAARLASRGARSMVVWSLATNEPARRFYEALGARFVEARRIPDFDIAVYGWDDTTPLRTPLTAAGDAPRCSSSSATR